MIRPDPRDQDLDSTRAFVVIAACCAVLVAAVIAAGAISNMLGG